MKKVIALALIALGTGIVNAQCAKRKRFTTGINFGINHANALISEHSTASIENGLGYRFGLISNLAITRRISLEPKAEISFNTSTIRDGAEEFSISPVDVEFITHLKFNSKRSILSPYIIIGPNVKVPIGNGPLILPTKNDLALDVGVGLDVPVGRVRVAPELRYSFGLMNITNSSSIEDIRFHNVSLILNIGGRTR